MLSKQRAILTGVGSYLPEKFLTNDDLSAIMDTNDEWVRTRTGIGKRHIAAEGEYTSDLGAKAAKAAMEHAKIRPEDVDLIIVATTTSDYSFPSTATVVQEKLGVTQGVAFDVQGVCSGFVYAMDIATSFLETGRARTALVIGAETMSRLLDWNDRSTAVLFGDGAGAVVLQAMPAEACGDKGVLGALIASDGRLCSILHTDGGISRTKLAGHVQMVGREVFRQAVPKMADSILQLCARLNMDITEMDWLVPHQANIRIINAVGERLGVPIEKVITTVEQHANTSAASIPLALAEGIRLGKIKPGQLLMMTAVGGGLTWGALALRW
jgi:3-oxoacyl-[acyl-carrier-protein] synthase-3